MGFSQQNSSLLLNSLFEQLLSMNFKAALGVIQQGVRDDTTLQQTTQYARRAVSAFPSASGRYLLEKAPVIQWLTKHLPRWLINDAIAGVTVGVILVPQALAYAKIAGIPLQDGLLAGWLPSMLYLIMGTSKGMFSFTKRHQVTTNSYQRRRQHRPNVDHQPPHRPNHQTSRLTRLHAHQLLH